MLRGRCENIFDSMTVFEADVFIRISGSKMCLAQLSWFSQIHSPVTVMVEAQVNRPITQTYADRNCIMAIVNSLFIVAKG